MPVSMLQKNNPEIHIRYEFKLHLQRAKVVIGPAMNFRVVNSLPFPSLKVPFPPGQPTPCTHATNAGCDSEFTRRNPQGTDSIEFSRLKRRHLLRGLN